LDFLINSSCSTLQTYRAWQTDLWSKTGGFVEIHAKGRKNHPIDLNFTDQAQAIAAGLKAAVHCTGLVMFNMFKRRSSMSTPEQNDLNVDSQNLADTLNVDMAHMSAEAAPEELAAELHGKIADLEAQLKDVQARANADMYNFQKRVERDTDNAKKYALEKFAGSLLDVVDNLERAIAAAGDQDSPLVEGIRLTQKSMLAALEKHGVLVVDPANYRNRLRHN
jgi:molecular chaperone GrpE